jgi:PAS domain S-box-containing protein
MPSLDLSKKNLKVTPQVDDFRFESSALLHEAIVHSSGDAIITKNLGGIITSWNPAATEIFGYTSEEITGQPILRLIPQRFHDEEQEILRKLRAGELIAHYETTRLTKDGREIVVSLTISPVKDETGRIVGISKLARDITNQKQSDPLRFWLSAIIESSDDAILSKDLNGIITSWNRGAQRIFGYTEAEILGKSILTLIPPELHTEEKTILQKLRAGERIDHFETIRLRKDGERIEVSLTISPVKNASGKIVGASKVLRDISDRKRMEKSLILAEKLAASGKMAATIAHEVNNPLEAILNLIYLARSNSSEPEQVNTFLNAAESELVRLSHIAKQTLGFYKENNSAISLPLSDLIRDALNIYAPRLASTGVELQTRLESTRKIVIKKGEIMQVISNMMANAGYAMPNGGVLSITVEDAIVDHKDGLLLTIADSGTGISDENLHRVFEPFFTTRSSIGTGIGLWVAKQFIEGHGGKITLQSSTDAVSHGTMISIFLPLENPYSEKPTSQNQEVLV